MKLSIHQIKQLNKLNGNGAMFAGRTEYFFDKEKSDAFVAAVTHECGILWSQNINFGIEDVTAALRLGVKEGYYPSWLLNEVSALKKITSHMQEKSFFAVLNERPILAGSKKAPIIHTVKRVSSTSNERIIPNIFENPGAVLNKEELFTLYTSVLETVTGELKSNNQPITRPNVREKIRAGIQNKIYPASTSAMPEKILQSAVDTLNSGGFLGSSKFREGFFKKLQQPTVHRTQSRSLSYASQ